MAETIFKRIYVILVVVAFATGGITTESAIFWILVIIAGILFDICDEIRRSME